MYCVMHFLNTITVQRMLYPAHDSASGCCFCSVLFITEYRIECCRTERVWRQIILALRAGMIYCAFVHYLTLFSTELFPLTVDPILLVSRTSQAGYSFIQNAIDL